MKGTIIGTILVFGLWLIVFATFVNIGLFSLKKLYRSETISSLWGDSFVVGLSIVLCFLQIWHFFFKVSGITFIIVISCGLFCIFNNRGEFRFFIHKNRNFLKFVTIAGFFIGIWLANRSLWYIEPLSGFTQWDTGSYHIQSVKWITHYPLIPGLANINHYFGFNSNYFLYASFFDFWIWNGKSSYLASGLLLYVAFLQSLVGFYHINSKDKTKSRIGIYQALVFIPLLLKANYINSLETDLPIFLLMILLGGQMYLFFLEREAKTINQNFRILIISLIVLIGCTIKINFIVFGLSSLLVVIVTSFIDTPQKRKKWAKEILIFPIVAGGMLLIPWLIRSVIISGYPMFPTVVFSFNLPWKVPEYIANEEYGHIRTVARVIKPGVDYAIINGYSWFPDWVKDIPKSAIKGALVGFFSSLFMAVLYIKRIKPFLNWAVFIPFIVYLPFWFLMAPAIRFIEGAFWSTIILLICFTISSFEYLNTDSTILSVTTIRGLIILSLFLWIRPLNGPLWIVSRSENITGLLEPYQPPVLYRSTRSGLVVAIPKEPQDELRCWDAPLPCVPIFNDRLEIFEFNIAGQNRFGFRLSSVNLSGDMNGTYTK